MTLVCWAYRGDGGPVKPCFNAVQETLAQNTSSVLALPAAFAGDDQQHAVTSRGGSGDEIGSRAIGFVLAHAV